MKEFFITIIILGVTSLLSNKISFLRKYRIPVSLTSSLLVLTLFTYFSDLKSTSLYTAWKSWPGIFISLIFASLFLERSETETKHTHIRESISESILVWITILGQMAIGLLLSILIFKPFFLLPLSFGSVLETGFAGGHGTAVAMNKSFTDNGLPSGQEFGLFSATVGLIVGIFGGILLIRKEKGVPEISEEVSSLEIDPIKVIISLSLIFTAFLIGSFFKENLLSLLSIIQEDSSFAFILRLKDLPLFIYCLVASLVLKFILKLLKLEYIIDNGLINLASNIFMELLIFSGIASIDMKVISNALPALMILFSAGILWNIYCHFYIRKKILKEEYSFELSLINYGMVNGTTGIGLMLLKMVDPECKSKALKVFAEASPFTAPFVGGGIITLALPYLVTNGNPYFILVLFLFVILNLYFIGIYIKKKYLNH